MKKKEREQQKVRRELQVQDPTLAAMDQIAYTEFRVRVGIMSIREYKIWAHDETDASNKVRDGAGTMSSQSPPEVVSVQVGKLGGGPITDTDALRTAKVVENALAQKNPNTQLPGDIAMKDTKHA